MKHFLTVASILANLFTYCQTQGHPAGINRGRFCLRW